MFLFPYILLSLFVNPSATPQQVYFIEHYHLAAHEEKVYGIPLMFTLAQAIHESDAGQSELAINANNHFGIKADRFWDGPVYTKASLEYEKGRWVRRISKFRKYESVEHCYRDRSSKLAASERYLPCFDCDTVECWMDCVGKMGWATDPRYSQKLERVLSQIQN